MNKKLAEALTTSLINKIQKKKSYRWNPPKLTSHFYNSHELSLKTQQWWIKIKKTNRIQNITSKSENRKLKGSDDYFVQNLRRLIVDEGNDSGTSRFSKFHIRSSYVRRISGVAEAAGGAVPRVADDSDDRSEIEIGVWHGAPLRGQEEESVGGVSVDGGAELNGEK